eukprot:1171609-Pleurochrysis_carterae.AAC.1
MNITGPCNMQLQTWLNLSCDGTAVSFAAKMPLRLIYRTENIAVIDTLVQLSRSSLLCHPNLLCRGHHTLGAKLPSVQPAELDFCKAHTGWAHGQT